MNRIIKGLVNGLLQSYESETRGEATDFEVFCNYSVVSRFIDQAFDIDLFDTGTMTRLTKLNSAVIDMLDFR